MTNCPLHCGYEGEMQTHEAAGVTLFVCPDCLGVGFDGAVLCDPRKTVDLSRLLKPIVEQSIRETSTDPLTKVRNRRFFMSRLANELKLAEHRYHVSVAAFRVDLDKLYRAGGTRGGDTVLQAVAAALLSQVRAGDNFARIDADTFGMILPKADEARAKEIAARIAELAAKRPYHTHTEKPVRIRISQAIVFARADEAADMLWRRLIDTFREYDEPF